VEYIDSYTYKNLTDSALKRDCNYSILDKIGGNSEIKVSSYYLKNIGEVKLLGEYYYNGEYMGETKIEARSTNFVSFDFNTDDSQIFSDLDSNHKNFNAIIYLRKEGIVNGYSDGTFKPENFVNRAELLKILVEGQDKSPDGLVYKDCFPDVKDDWYARYVCYAKEEGWVNGYPDGTFKPEQTVNKVEAIKMLLNSQGVALDSQINFEFYKDVNSEDWFWPYVSKAKEMSLLEEAQGGNFEPDAGMRRASICENLMRLLLQIYTENKWG
ncbi:hypothetical protein GF354_05580, partial [Candidatus Peregrinibacteria bacterium]|nr:hypothetical protein [Candidatus Peregrinibacteria bacterium]